jgi:hypothetical protein
MPGDLDQVRLTDQAAHRQPQLQFVGGEVDLRARLRIRNESDLVERAQVIEKLRRRLHDRTQRSRPHARLVYRDQDHAPVDRRQVAGEERLGLVGNLLFRRGDVDLDQLGGDDAPGLAVDLDGELGSTQIFNGLAAAIDDGHVDCSDLDAGAERRALEGFSWGCLGLRSGRTDGGEYGDDDQGSAHGRIVTHMPGACRPGAEGDRIETPARSRHQDRLS